MSFISVALSRSVCGNELQQAKRADAQRWTHLSNCKPLVTFALDKFLRSFFL